jgi:hypothetical protein
MISVDAAGLPSSRTYADATIPSFLSLFMAASRQQGKLLGLWAQS